MARRRRSPARVLLIVVVAVAVYVARQDDAPGGSTSRLVGTAAPQAGAGTAQVQELFASRTSGEMVLVEGRVERTLRDDNEGSRHQRFILELAGGHTLLPTMKLRLVGRRR